MLQGITLLDNFVSLCEPFLHRVYKLFNNCFRSSLIFLFHLITFLKHIVVTYLTTPCQFAFMYSKRIIGAKGSGSQLSSLIITRVSSNLDRENKLSNSFLVRLLLLAKASRLRSLRMVRL